MHEPEIEYLIRSLGIGATYRGYEYLIYGIRLCLSDENYLLFVSKLAMSKTPHIQYLCGFARHGNLFYHSKFIVTINSKWYN